MNHHYKKWGCWTERTYGFGPGTSAHFFKLFAHISGIFMMLLDPGTLGYNVALIDYTEDDYDMRAGNMLGNEDEVSLDSGEPFSGE